MIQNIALYAGALGLIVLILLFAFGGLLLKLLDWYDRVVAEREADYSAGDSYLASQAKEIEQARYPKQSARMREPEPMGM